MPSITNHKISAVKYYGGKCVNDYISKLEVIINRIYHEWDGNGKVYDLFGGAAHVIMNVMAYDYSPFNEGVYNEWDPCMFEFISCFKDKIMQDELVECLKKIPPTEEYFNKARSLWDNCIARDGLTDCEPKKPFLSNEDLDLYIKKDMKYWRETDSGDIEKIVTEEEHKRTRLDRIIPEKADVQPNSEYEKQKRIQKACLPYICHQYSIPLPSREYW